MNISELVRPNIVNLKPYSSARDEYSGKEATFLDANENPFENSYNRYPDPLQIELKQKISEIKQVPVKNIFLGNGSDEPIDVLFRVFCGPGKDNIVSIDPSYGMYQVCADINNIEVRNVLLTNDFQLNNKSILAACDANTKLIFLCSPNNPTGNSLNNQDIKELITSFNGLVVVDEAYIDFSNNESLLADLNQYPNLVVLQTFSKAWGLAGIRLGMAFASTEILGYMNKVKYPYNVNILTQRVALEQLSDLQSKEEKVTEIINGRKLAEQELAKINGVEKIFPSDANFLLVKVRNSSDLFRNLIEKKIIVRDRSKVSLCEGCLRITIGTLDETKRMIEAVKAFYYE